MQDRDQLLLSIGVARNDQNYLVAEISRLAGYVLPSHKARRAGRPKSITTLAQELDNLDFSNAWLWKELIQIRGEPVFGIESGAQRLSSLGIVSEPQRPIKRGKGRPLKSGKEDALVFWTDLILATRKHRNVNCTVREALNEAHGIVEGRLQSVLKGASRTQTRSIVSLERSYYRIKRAG